MKIAFMKHEDTWQDVKNATMNTIGKAAGKYPNSFWKRKLLMAEHSPIRKLKFSWRWENLPYWVSVHFVRHKIGIEHFVKTQRTDRTGINRDELPQGAPVSHECEADAQALINISRKRLCNAAAAETRAAWQLVKDEVAKVEPELASCMVRECVYRGHCPEMFPCGYCNTPAYKKAREDYLNFMGVLTPAELGQDVYVLVCKSKGRTLCHDCYLYTKKERIPVNDFDGSDFDMSFPIDGDLSEQEIIAAVREHLEKMNAQEQTE